MEKLGGHFAEDSVSPLSTPYRTRHGSHIQTKKKRENKTVAKSQFDAPQLSGNICQKQSLCPDMGASQNWGYLSGGPCNEDDNILGLYWGPPIFGKYHIFRRSTILFVGTSKAHPYFWRNANLFFRHYGNAYNGA